MHVPSYFRMVALLAFVHRETPPLLTWDKVTTGGFWATTRSAAEGNAPATL